MRTILYFLAILASASSYSQTLSEQFDTSVVKYILNERQSGNEFINSFKVYIVVQDSADSRCCFTIYPILNSKELEEYLVPAYYKRIKSEWIIMPKEHLDQRLIDPLGLAFCDEQTFITIAQKLYPNIVGFLSYHHNAVEVFCIGK